MSLSNSCDWATYIMLIWHYISLEIKVRRKSQFLPPHVVIGAGIERGIVSYKAEYSRGILDQRRFHFRRLFYGLILLSLLRMIKYVTKSVGHPFLRLLLTFRLPRQRLGLEPDMAYTFFVKFALVTRILSKCWQAEIFPSTRCRKLVSNLVLPYLRVGAIFRRMQKFDGGKMGKFFFL